MFGIGMPEMLLILAIALIVIGPKKLPDLAKSLGKALGEFKRATSELKESIQVDSNLKEVKSAFNDINKDLNENRAVPPDETGAPPASAGGAEKTANGNPVPDTDAVEEHQAATDRPEDPPTPMDKPLPPVEDNGTLAGAADPQSETPKE